MLCHEVYVCKEMENPSKSMELLSSIHLAYVKAAMAHVFAGSSERSVIVWRKPAMTVKALEKIKSGSMMLVYLSKIITPVTARSNKITNDSIVVKNLYTDKDDDEVHGIVKSDLRFPREEHRGCARTQADVNIVAAWACKETVIQNESNAVRSTKEVFIKVGSAENISIKVPTIVNTRQILAGEEIVVLKPSCEVHSDEDIEPPAKKVKPMPAAAAAGKGKPAGTGKGSGGKSNGKNKSDGKKGKGKQGSKR